MVVREHGFGHFPSDSPDPTPFLGVVFLCFHVLKVAIFYFYRNHSCKGRTINDLGRGGGKSGKKNQLLPAWGEKLTFFLPQEYYS